MRLSLRECAIDALRASLLFDRPLDIVTAE
jgi:hypothetical protein